MDEVSRELAELREAFRQGSETYLFSCIASGDLITPADLANRLGVPDEDVEQAIKSGRMFAMESPDGLKYVPAFFAAPALNKGVLAQASQIIAELPAASRYFFFTAHSTFLHGQTPLEALADGKVDKVMTAAEAFRIR